MQATMKREAEAHADLASPHTLTLIQLNSLHWNLAPTISLTADPGTDNTPESPNDEENDYGSTSPIANPF
jgi:hypothetical protein